jgi:hypothetical protein
VPFLPVALVGRAVAVISGLPRGTVTALVESLSHDMVCREDDVLGDLLGGHHDFVTLRAALERSLAPEDDATDPRGDLQSGDANDPEWAGGAVTSSPAGRGCGRAPCSRTCCSAPPSRGPNASPAADRPENHRCA